MAKTIYSLHNSKRILLQNVDVWHWLIQHVCVYKDKMSFCGYYETKNGILLSDVNCAWLMDGPTQNNIQYFPEGTSSYHWDPQAAPEQKEKQAFTYDSDVWRLSLTFA
jgi:hypothetical protein